MSKNVSRVLVLLIVLATVVTGAAQAAPRTLEAPEPSTLSALWEWVVSWFQPSGLSAVWAEEGCSMDPDGRCRNGATTGEGSGTDPDGVTSGDEGSHMDPDGRK